MPPFTDQLSSVLRLFDETRHDVVNERELSMALAAATGRTGKYGVDERPHGFTEARTPPFIEGEITDWGDFNLRRLLSIENATVTQQLGNGKVIAPRNAFYAGDGTGNTDEGNIAVRFVGASADEQSRSQFLTSGLPGS